MGLTSANIMKRFILLTAIFGIVSLSAVAQQQATLRTIKGYVFNAEGDAMPGADVKAVADSAATKAAADGTFSIEVTLCKVPRSILRGIYKRTGRDRRHDEGLQVAGRQEVRR